MPEFDCSPFVNYNVFLGTKVFMFYLVDISSHSRYIPKKVSGVCACGNWIPIWIRLCELSALSFVWSSEAVHFRTEVHTHNCELVRSSREYHLRFHLFPSSTLYKRMQLTCRTTRRATRWRSRTNSPAHHRMRHISVSTKTRQFPLAYLSVRRPTCENCTLFQAVMNETGAHNGA